MLKKLSKYMKGLWGLAAISAAVECLGEPNGLEHVNFSQRFNHFAQRLENCPRRVDATAPVRPPIDRLFFDEARECLEHVLTALQRLPEHDAEMLTAGGNQALIVLGDQVYNLRITRAGKLILTK